MTALDVFAAAEEGDRARAWIAADLASLLDQPAARSSSVLHVLSLTGGAADSTHAVVLTGEWATIAGWWPALFHCRLDPAGATSGAERGIAHVQTAILPFPDHSFDIVVNAFGAAFSARPEAMLSEMLRVCRSRGRLLMANWTPDGVFGHIPRLIGKYAASAVCGSAALWGDECAMDAQLSGRALRLKFKRRALRMRFGGQPSEVAARLSVSYAPLARALHGLASDQKREFCARLSEMWVRRNLASDGGTEVAADYLAVAAVRA